MSQTIPNGSRKEVDGKPRIYYDGYWIRFYPPPEESLASKKDLLDVLTRRTFHHTEPGINTPGNKVEAARSAYQKEQDPARKRVNAAMLAGALFNRATDIFTSIVELEEKGIHVSRENELMKACSSCFQEALELGKLVKHPSGHEGVDELWGEPFKVFTFPISDYYESRYVKIAQTMRAIDSISERIVQSLAPLPCFERAIALVYEYAKAAREEAEIMKSDPDFFQSWPDFVALGEALYEFTPELPEDASEAIGRHVSVGKDLLLEGRNLVSYIAGVRVPMPKSTNEFVVALDEFDETSERLGLIKSPVSSRL